MNVFPFFFFFFFLFLTNKKAKLQRELHTSKPSFKDLKTKQDSKTVVRKRFQQMNTIYSVKSLLRKNICYSVIFTEHMRELYLLFLCLEIRDFINDVECFCRMNRGTCSIIICVSVWFFKVMTIFWVYQIMKIYI